MEQVPAIAAPDDEFLVAAPGKEVATAVPGDAVAPPPGNPRFPLIDSLRAVAALCIVILHAWFLSGAAVSSRLTKVVVHLNVGVTLFFLISGFLLYRPFVAARAGAVGPVRVIDYARRRVLRVYPAFWLVVVVLTIYPGLTSVFDDRWWHHLLLAEPPDCDPRVSALLNNCGISQVWSLSVEVLFYLGLPAYALLIKLALRPLRPRSRVAAELATLGVLGVGAACLPVVFHDYYAWSWPVKALPSFVQYFVWFAIGMGMAVVSSATLGRNRRRRRSLPVHWSTAAWVAALVLYLVASLLVLPPEPGAGFSPAHQLAATMLFGSISALVIAPAIFGSGRSGLPRRILGNRVLAWLGLVSYGIFLWHLAVGVQLSGQGRNWWLPGGHHFLVLTLAMLAVTAAIAAASYYLLERPVLRFKNRRHRLARARSPADRSAA